MFVINLTTIYWNKTIKLLILYLVLVLFVIAMMLLINEVFIKRDYYFIKKQKENKVIRLLAYRKANSKVINQTKEIVKDNNPKRIISYVKHQKNYYNISSKR